MLYIYNIFLSDCMNKNNEDSYVNLDTRIKQLKEKIQKLSTLNQSTNTDKTSTSVPTDFSSECSSYTNCYNSSSCSCSSSSSSSSSCSSSSSSSCSSSISSSSSSSSSCCDKLDELQCTIEYLDNVKADKEETDYLKAQLSSIGNQYDALLGQQKINDTRYNQILTELNNLYDLVTINQENITNITNIINNEYDLTKVIVYEQVNITNTLKIDVDSYVFITMVGGGGAGGIGYINNIYYYGGGGGGSGSFIVNKPIQVVAGTIIYTTVGEGGDISVPRNGGSSTVIILDPSGNTETIIVCGGKNGHPSDPSDTSVLGGAGGSCDGCIITKGIDGDPGTISVPSQISAIGGKGGCSNFDSGGAGGGTYSIENSVILIGEDGRLGSGGGGSAPRMLIEGKLSGYGGNGIIILNIYKISPTI